MTNTAQKAQDFPVFFGWDAPATDPSGSIQDVAKVISAMNYLIHQQRDPNNLGESPDGDERQGISFIFEACTRQLQAVSGLVAKNETDADLVSGLMDKSSFVMLSTSEKALILCRAQGMTFAQIAEAMNLDGEWDARRIFDRISEQHGSIPLSAPAAETEAQTAADQPETSYPKLPVDEPLKDLPTPKKQAKG